MDLQPELLRVKEPEHSYVKKVSCFSGMEELEAVAVRLKEIVGERI